MIGRWEFDELVFCGQSLELYCTLYLASYWGHQQGSAWARTRTVKDNINPIWGESFAFEVTDPSSVLFLALAHDPSSSVFRTDAVVIGLMRLRLSTLLPNRLYKGKFPLLRRGGSRGAEAAGEVQLAMELKVLSSASVESVWRLSSEKRHSPWFTVQTGG